MTMNHAPKLRTLAERVRYCIDTFCSGDEASFANICRVGPSVLRDVLRGKAKPFEIEQLIAGIRRLGRFDAHWIRTGQGRAEAANGDATAPPPAPDPEEVPRRERWISAVMASNLDWEALGARTGLDVERIRTIADRGDGTVSDDELLAVADLGSIINPEWVLSGQGPRYRLRDDREGPGVAPEATGPSGGRLEALEGRVEGLTSASLAAAEAIGEMAARVEEVAIRRVSVEMSPDFRRKLTEMIDEAVGLVKKDAKIDVVGRVALERRISALAEKVGAMQGIDRATVEGHARSLGRIDQQVASLLVLKGDAESLAKSLANVLAAVDALNERLTLVEAAVAAGHSRPVRRPHRESDLQPDEWLSIDEWLALPGPYGRAIRDTGDRKTMGRRVNQAYEAVGFDRSAVPQGSSNNRMTYDVRSMRLYAEWLSRAGLEPTDADWLAHYGREIEGKKSVGPVEGRTSQ